MDPIYSCQKNFKSLHHHPMEDILEEFLIQKLGADIKNAQEKYKNVFKYCKLFVVHEECLKLKVLIEGRAPGTGAALKHTRREKLYYLLNVMTEWLQLLEKQPFVNPAAMTWAEELHGRLKLIEKDLKEPLEGQSQGGGGSQKPPKEDDGAQDQIYRWSSHAVDTTKIHGFKDKGMIMERLLLKEGPKVIAITGVAGVGKTALCQVAFNNGEVQKHFPLRIWLCLSRQQRLHADEEFLVKRALSCLGFEDGVIERVGQGGVDKLKAALQQQLHRGGEYLVVLDDAWNIEEGDDEMGKKIQSLLSFFIKYEGTVILTSRSRSGKLEKTVPPEKLHRLKLLPLADDNSCWSIFTDAVNTGEILGLEKLREKTLKNCQGLPLMAKMLGQICHDQLIKNLEKTSENQTQLQETG